MPFLFNPCSPCCNTCKTSVPTACCSNAIKRGLKLTLSATSGWSELAGVQVYLNYNDFWDQWDGSAIINGIIPNNVTSPSPFPVSHIVVFSLKCLSGSWVLYAYGRAYNGNSSLGGTQWPAQAPVMGVTSGGIVTPVGALTTIKNQGTLVSSACSPLNLVFTFSGAQMDFPTNNLQVNNVVTVSFTATIVEWDCSDYGQITEWGNGHTVIPDVLTCAIGGTCPLSGKSLVVTRRYNLEMTWVGWMMNNFNFGHNGYDNVFMVALTFFPISGAGSSIYQWVLTVWNVDISSDTGFSWSTGGNSPPGGSLVGGDVPTSVSSSPLQIDFTGISGDNAEGSAFAGSNIVCFVGHPGDPTWNFTFTPGAGFACCGGEPNTLHASISLNATVWPSFPIQYVPQLGVWRGRQNVTVGSDTLTAFQTVYCGSASDGRTDIYMGSSALWRHTSPSTDVLNELASDSFVTAGGNVVACSPFAIDIGNPTPFGGTTHVMPGNQYGLFQTAFFNGVEVTA